MSSLPDDQIRHVILELLYKVAKDHPESSGMQRDEMYEILKIPKNQIEFNMSYLEQKLLVKRSAFMGPPYWFASITALGIDVVENKEEYKKEFPFIQANIQEIHGDIYAPVIQAVGSKVDFKQQINNAFQQAHEITEKRSMESSLKEQIQKQLTLLEEELEKEEADLGKVQRLWKRLKENASWLVPTLADVVIESVKLAMGG